MSPFRYRWRIRRGPLRLNGSGLRVTSVAVKLGPWTWNPVRRTVTTDLPGRLSHVRRYGSR